MSPNTSRQALFDECYPKTSVIIGGRMTGNEMHKILEKTGIKGKELAEKMGFPTPSRVYKASNSGSSEVQTIFEIAFERLIGKSRFDSMLQKLRDEEVERQLRAVEAANRYRAELKRKAEEKEERKRLRAQKRETQLNSRMGYTFNVTRREPFSYEDDE